MNNEQIATLTKLNTVMLTRNNAARATLEEVKAAFPNGAAITNRASIICSKQLKMFREEFEKGVDAVFIAATTMNTIKI